MMTTVAYKDGVLASDSRATMGTRILSDEMQKIFEVAGKGYMFEGEEVLVFALAGDYAGKLMLDKLFTQVDDEGVLMGLEAGHCLDTDDEFDALLVTDTGAFVVMKNADSPLVKALPLGDVPFSIGSGADTARVLMRMGYSAEDAVRETIKHDSGSGGDVQCWKR